LRTPSDQLVRDIGYSFKDSSILETALTHRSAGKRNNERFEFLGDAILGFVIADHLFINFDDASEGELSRSRAALVKKDSLADIARGLNLGNYLNLGIGELKSGGQSRASILADTLEAVFAAIYLDGGYEAARDVVLKLFSQRLNSLGKESQQKDPKTRLQEYLQSRKLALPTYSVTLVEGEQHDQLFTVQCRVEKLSSEATGNGSSRKQAEQDAAETLLEQITHA